MAVAGGLMPGGISSGAQGLNLTQHSRAGIARDAVAPRIKRWYSVCDKKARNGR
jgi:hypothetical protein